MAPHRPAFLRKSGHVECAESITFQMNRHANNGADGHYACTANTIDEHAVGFIKCR